MTRDQAIAHTADYLASGQFEADLARRVAIPTESQDPRGAPHLARYLDEELIPAFATMGFTTQVYPNPKAGPVLLATRDEGANLTVLGYGHGDVVRGQEERWTKGAGPWQTARDGDRLYGRGTADNKAQHSINMAGLRAVLETRGRLGFNAKFLIEMGEEAGSAGLGDVIAANREAFAADVFIASDGPRVHPDRPTVSLGARGAINFDLVSDLRDGAHHSGNWGGALADPAMILAHALASIAGPTGQILVPEWLPPPMSNAVRAALSDVTLNPGADGPEIDPDWGEPGMTTAEKGLWLELVRRARHGLGQHCRRHRSTQSSPPRARTASFAISPEPMSTTMSCPRCAAHLDAAWLFERVAIEPPDRPQRR